MKIPKTLRIFFFCLWFISPNKNSEALAAQAQEVLVDEVLTGDTLRLSGGKTLRYAGLQAPPLQSIIPLVRQYGQSSLEFNRDLVEKKVIKIEWGPQIRDDKSNLLGYVFLEDGRSVNQIILEEGFAKLKIIPPNNRYSMEFRRAELNARRSKKGLWAEEPENPYIRHEFIGDTNTKIFYFPTSPELEKIPPSHLITFRSRVEAKAAGYRRCPNCHEESDVYTL